MEVVFPLNHLIADDGYLHEFDSSGYAVGTAIEPKSIINDQRFSSYQ